MKVFRILEIEILKIFNIELKNINIDINLSNFQ